LEKSAMTAYVEKRLFREGILKPGSFTQNYDLHCYEPTDSLRPFIEHYFISRRRNTYDTNYVGNDVLAQPVVSLFFKPEEVYFEGPTKHARTLVAKESPIYAGVQFRPGGFYPFWMRSVSELAEIKLPASAIFPEADKVFASRLLKSADNQAILSSIEALFAANQLQPDPSIELINTIMAEIEHLRGMTTVANMADTFSMSERTLQQLFRTYVGVGAKWSIMRVRFLEVIKLVREQDKPDWTAIALDFGYSDQSHFINDFKNLLGQSPSQYTRNHSRDKRP
jgi:AraC-like DNA-binding protein